MIHVPSLERRPDSLLMCNDRALLEIRDPDPGFFAQSVTKWEDILFSTLFHDFSTTTFLSMSPSQRFLF